jgi:hypothetical protein
MILRRWPVILATGTVVAGAVVALGAALSASAPSSAEALGAARNSAQLTAPPVTMTPASITHAPNPPTGPPVLRVKFAKDYLECFTPGVILYVTQNNIHIRQLPNGANIAPINRRAWFDSILIIDGKGPYHCMTSQYTARTLWVFGFANHNHNLVGYVGFNWLNFRNYVK